MAFALYSLNKITDTREDAINMPQRLGFIAGRRKLIIALALMAYSLCLLQVVLQSPPSVLFVLFPFAANVLYGIRLHPLLPRLKDIPVMKNVVVAVSWAVPLTFLVAARAGGDCYLAVPLVFGFILVKAFTNTVLYDMRDVTGDRENGIRTIPVLIGPKRTILVLLAFDLALFPTLLIFDGISRIIASILALNGLACAIHFRDSIDPLQLELLVDGEWMLACLAFYLLASTGLLI